MSKKPTAFQSAVVARMQYLCRYASTDGRDLTGAEAATRMLENLERAKDAPLTDYEEVGSFSWLLSAAERKKFKDTYDAFQQKAHTEKDSTLPTVSTPVSKRSSAASAAASSKKQKQASTDVDATLAMFRTKLKA